VTPERYLIVALSNKGYGETLLGVRLARELQASGASVEFLIHEAAAPLLADTTFGQTPVPESAGPIFPLLLMARLRALQPRTVLLSDYSTTAIFLERHGVDPALLGALGVPVGAIDIWDMARTGSRIDVFGGQTRQLPDWFGTLDYALVPTPIGNPLNGGRCYSCLPGSTPVRKKVQRHLRRTFRLGDDDRLVLMCTAAWQHTTFRSDAANQTAQLVPQLIAHHVRSVDPRVHLVHVGPQRFELDSDERYHWIPPVEPERFELLVGSADLVMGANISSTTISQAMVHGVPNLVLINSRSAEPFFPFALWPIGYHAYVRPVLEGNPYVEAVNVTEILDEAVVKGRIRELLFDEAARAAAIARQAAYLERLAALPTGAELLRAALRDHEARSAPLETGE
jgi:hypothetical protein